MIIFNNCLTKFLQMNIITCFEWFQQTLGLLPWAKKRRSCPCHQTRLHLQTVYTSNMHILFIHLFLLIGSRFLCPSEAGKVVKCS